MFVQLIETAPLLSDAVAIPFCIADVSAVQSIVTFAGQVIVGAASSLTEILCAHVDEFPHPSVAVKVRVMR